MIIVWSRLALERVMEIADYIAADKPIAAHNWVTEIFDAVENLANFPELGRGIPEIWDKRYRQIIKGNYRIIYKLEDGKVYILTVRHGRQILPLDEIQS